MTIGPALRMLGAMREQRWRLALAALLGALALACAVGLAATSAYLISRASQMPPILMLQIAIVGVRAFGIGRGVFRYAERVVGHDAAFRGLTGLRVRMYERLERLAPAGLRDSRSGDLLARLVGDVDAGLDLSLRAALPFLAAALVGTGSVVLAWWILPAAGLVLLVALLVGGLVVPALTLAGGAAAERRIAPARGRLAAEVVTTIGSAPDLIALGAADRAMAAVRDADAQVTRQGRRSAWTLAAATGLGVLTLGLAVAGSLLVGARAVSDGALDGVLLAVVVLLPLAAYEAVAALPAAALAFARARASAARVFAVVDAVDPCPDPQEPVALPGGPARVEASGLSVAWAADAGPVVHDVAFVLEPGRTVALVGPSGAGKSTIAMALLRFLPYRGSLRIDGTELHDLVGDGVRRAVGLLAQDAHLFDTTVLENLRLARPDAGIEDLLAAVDAAGLGPWLAGLPDGLDTPVGSHGARLSGGQRQRLALARLLLARHPVVVLDEPAEHLDPVEAAAIMRDVLAALADRAVLLITHDADLAATCDEVLVLVAGRFAAPGRRP